MIGVARVGDSISHGGVITSGSLKLFENGVSLARVGDAVICNIHGAQTIISGSTKVFENGLGVARVGDSISCGAIITTGSTKIFLT
ncbi:MAG: hypothetical protein D6813_13900 [Calditrichaeota bacterium]|nr:MAG: hypothetical protein D6813_13900 [Calditrichota bacterium]